MTYKLNIDRNITPKLNALQAWSPTPVGWWNVTTEGDVEGRSIKQLGNHYGHLAAVALCITCTGDTLRFTHVPASFKVTVPQNTKQRIVTKEVNIMIDQWSHRGGEKQLEEWLNCDEIRVMKGNFYGSYKIQLVD
jgi:hypothetical protein